MLTITGEVRKVLDRPYKDGQQRQVNQVMIIIEPAEERQNYEVFLTSAQINQGAREAWLAMIGKQASVPVSLFVNHEYKFHKFNALGKGLPQALPVQANRNP